MHRLVFYISCKLAGLLYYGNDLKACGAISSSQSEMHIFYERCFVSSCLCLVYSYFVSCIRTYNTNTSSYEDGANEPPNQTPSIANKRYICATLISEP